MVVSPRITRLRLATGVVVLLLAAPVVAETPHAGKLFGIEYLGTAPPTTPTSARTDNALRDGLRDLGWVDGQNIVTEARYPEGKDERLPDLAPALQIHRTCPAPPNINHE